MKTLFRKTILFALAAALGLAAMPFVSAAAAGENDPTPPPQGRITSERLERIWAHQVRIFDRIGRADKIAERIQALIDLAKANGKDVSAIQAAMDAFEAALKDAHPIYESAKGIVNSHQGFDSNGKVTDLASALTTVKVMREKFREIRGAMNGTGKALRAAIRAFREANSRPK